MSPLWRPPVCAQTNIGLHVESGDRRASDVLSALESGRKPETQSACVKQGAKAVRFDRAKWEVVMGPYSFR